MLAFGVSWAYARQGRSWALASSFPAILICSSFASARLYASLRVRTRTAAPSSDVTGALSSSAAIARAAGNSSATEMLYRTPTSTHQRGRLRCFQRRRCHGVPHIPVDSRVEVFHIQISWFVGQYGKSERESVSRILFLLSRGEGNGHSSGRTVARALKRPNPEGKRGATLARTTGILLFGLAPGGVCPAALIAEDPGELLPHLFTLTDRTDRAERQRQSKSSLSLISASLLRRRSFFCGTFPASQRAAVNGHPAPWSPDFPRAYRCGTRPFDPLSLNSGVGPIFRRRPPVQNE